MNSGYFKVIIKQRKKSRIYKHLLENKENPFYVKIVFFPD